MNREELIAHCEASIVPQSEWSNRDTSDAQRQLGECLVLLKAGCDFVAYFGNGKIHSSNVLEVEITFHGFNWFELGEEDALPETDTFYLPLPQEIASRPSKDWY